jgi:DNA-directed RNA polymerase subunit RPC12/RpoP
MKKYCKYCYKKTEMELAESDEIHGDYYECQECGGRAIIRDKKPHSPK